MKYNNHTLEELLRIYDKGWGFPVKTFDEHIGGIQAIAEACAPKWISVKDLPTEDGDFQVCIHRRDAPSGTRYTGFASTYAHAHVGGWYWEIEYSGKWVVTHYAPLMPLPEPPK